MQEKQIDSTGDAQEEIKEVEDLRASIDSLVETITEQVAKEEEEKLQTLELKAKEDEQVQADTATAEDFRGNLLSELQMFNENAQDYTVYFEAIIEHQKVELELYNVVYFASVIVIIFGCLMPLFWVVKQLKNMANSFF